MQIVEHLVKKGAKITLSLMEAVTHPNLKVQLINKIVRVINENGDHNIPKIDLFNLANRYNYGGGYHRQVRGRDIFYNMREQQLI